MADSGKYLKKIENERNNIIQTAFWSEYIAGILELRKKASRNCETYDDVKEDQGKIQAYDKVLGLPEKIVSIVEDKNKKRENTQSD